MPLTAFGHVQTAERGTESPKSHSQNRRAWKGPLEIIMSSPLLQPFLAVGCIGKQILNFNSKKQSPQPLWELFQCSVTFKVKFSLVSVWNLLCSISYPLPLVQPRCLKTAFLKGRRAGTPARELSHSAPPRVRRAGRGGGCGGSRVRGSRQTHFPTGRAVLSAILSCGMGTEGLLVSVTLRNQRARSGKARITSQGVSLTPN